MMPDCIIVLGMHQGGNSIFAELLTILGVNFGKDRLLLSKENSAELFENKKVLQINENILESINSSYDDMEPLPTNWWQETHLKGHKKEIISILKKELNDESMMFAIKDARFSRLLPLWNAAFSEMGLIPHVVIMVRNPFEVAELLKEKNGFSREKSLGLWMTHMLDAEYCSREFPRTFQTFKDLISDPEESIRQISKRLKLDFPRAFTEAKPAIERILELTLTSHQPKIEKKSSLVLKLIIDYYELLKTASQQAALNEADRLRIDRIKAEYNENRSYFINREHEEKRRKLIGHIRQMENKQVVLKKQIENHIGLLRRREFEIADLEREITVLEQKIGAQSARLGELYKANSELELIYNSRSWKITEPLRAIAKFYRERFSG